MVVPRSHPRAVSAGLLSVLVLSGGGHLRAANQAAPPAVVAGAITALAERVCLPGVTVTLTTDDGAPVATATTDQDGRYRLEVPRTGAFRLTAALQGFVSATRAVELATGATSTVDLELRLSAVVQTIDVTPDTGLTLNLARPLSFTETLDGRWISEFVMTAGNVAEALRSLPSVTRYGREWAIKGGRPNQVSVQVDAAQFIDPAAGTNPVMLPGDAVETLQVLANPYSVEFGRFSTGVVLASTRRGDSAWSASLNNFLPGFRLKRGDNPFHVQGIESLAPRFTVRGPIRRNRAFLAQSLQFRYQSREVASRPQDERRISKSVNSFTRLDLILTPHHTLSGTVAVTPMTTSAATLNTFNPPEVTADLTQRAYRGALIETAQLPHGMLLESLVHVTGYGAMANGHGSATQMVLAPESNAGIYYAHRDGRSFATEWSARLSRSAAGPWGQHMMKAGVDVIHATYQGDHRTRPIEILREDGTRTRRLSATTSRLQVAATDGAVFLQDRWLLNRRVMVELGLRGDRDGVLGRVSAAPRLGAAVTLNREASATIRGGWGYFFERTPILVGAFPQLSPRYESAYAADGATLLGAPVLYRYDLDGARHTPRSTAWNVSYEHRIAPWVSMRVNHLQRTGRHELAVDTGHQETRGWISLSTTGRARYRDTEVGVRLSRGAQAMLDLSYTRSSSMADLNSAYDYFLSPTANPVVRANAFGPADNSLPNRLVGRGQALVGRNWMFGATGEISTGVPFSAVDEQLEFVGPRNSRRFPTRAVLDVSVERRFDVGKFRPWLGFVVVNALQRSNPSDVQRNVASPSFGTFFSDPVRQIRLIVTFRR